MLVMFSLFCPLPCLRGVLEFARSFSNVLIIFVLFHVFGECSSLPLVLVMFSLFCPLPSLRGVLVLEFLLTSMSSWQCSSLPLVLVMFSLFCSLPCLRGVLEFARSFSNVLIILSTAPSVSNVSLFFPLPCLRGVLEFARSSCSFSNVLIILSTSMSSCSGPLV